MSNFIKNFNIFLEHYKIKQNILAMKTNYSDNKLSRMLTGKQQKISIDEMTTLANGVGKDIDYFMNDMVLESLNNNDSVEIAFNSGTPTKESQEFANILFDFLEHVDLIIGMENKLNKNLNEVLLNGI